MKQRVLRKLALLFAVVMVFEMPAQVLAEEIVLDEDNVRVEEASNETEVEVVSKNETALDETVSMDYVSEEYTGVVTPTDGGEIKSAVIMASTYYYMENENYDEEYDDEEFDYSYKYILPFYFEINKEALPQTVHIDDLIVKIDGKEYICETTDQIGEDDIWTGVEVYGVGRKITAGETLSCDVQLLCGDRLIYEKSGISLQPAYIEGMEKYTVTSYSKKIPFSILTPVYSSAYKLIVIDENGKEVISKETGSDDIDSENSLWKSYYQNIFVNGDELDYEDIFGSLNGTRLKGYISLNAPLAQGKNYGLKCVSLEKKESFTLTESDVYAVRNGGEVLNVKANIIETDNTMLYLEFYGISFDNERIKIILTDVSGNQAGEMVSKSIKPLSDWEMSDFDDLQEDEFAYNHLQRLSCRIRLNSENISDELFYQLTTTGDYICVVPENKKLHINRYADMEDYRSENWDIMESDVWLNRYPNQIGMNLNEKIPHNTLIKASLYEDSNLEKSVASAQGRVYNNTVNLEFYKASLAKYTFSNSHKYIIKYSADVNGNMINGTREFTLEMYQADKWYLEEGCAYYYDTDKDYIPVTFYYLDEKYDTCVNMTCALRENQTDLAGTNVDCEWELVSYHGMKVLRFNAEIPKEKMNYGRYFLHIKGTITGAYDLKQTFDECPLYLDHRNEPPYKVVSYSYDTSGTDYVTTFVLNRFISEEDINKFSASLSRQEAVSKEANGKTLIVTHSGELSKNVMKREMYLSYGQNNQMYYVQPVAPCDDFDVEKNVYSIYLNEKTGGFLTTHDEIRGQTIISGTYTHNIDYPVSVDVRKIYSEDVVKSFSLTEAGYFPEELFSAIDSDQIYELCLRDQNGFIFANQQGYIGKPEKEKILRYIQVKTKQEIGEIGSLVDLSKITVFAEYFDGSNEPVSLDDCTLSPNTIEKKGRNNIEIYYNGKKDCISVLGYTILGDGDIKPSYDLNGTMLNLFYTDEASRTSTVSLNALTDSLITKVTLDEAMAECFDVKFDLQKQKLSLVLKKEVFENEESAKKMTNTGYASFTIAGYEPEVKALIIIPMTYEKPEIKLSKKTVFIPLPSGNEYNSSTDDIVYALKKEKNDWKILSNLGFLEVYRYGEILDAEADTGGEISFYCDNLRYFRQARKVKIGIQEQNWAEPIPVSVIVMATKKSAGPHLTRSSMTLDRSIPGMQATALYYSGSNVLDEWITLSPAKDYKNAPTVDIQELNGRTCIFTSSLNENTKKGTYTYILRYWSGDKGKRIKVKVVETNFTKKIPTAKSKVIKKTNEKKDGEAGAAIIRLKPQLEGTCISAVEKAVDLKNQEISDKFVVKPVYEGKQIYAVKIYAKDTADASLKSGKIYKLKLRITCASVYDNSEIAVDKTNAKLDKKRIVTVNVKVK